ncbi:MAG: hypothetical protein AAF772_20775, partial [Acidobacteriota bacterium]
RDDRGLGLHASWETRGRLRRTRLASAAWLGEQRGRGDGRDWRGRRVGALDARHVERWTRGRWRVDLDLAAGVAWGDRDARSDDASSRAWRQDNGHLRLALGYGSGATLTLVWHGAQVDDADDPRDRLRLGGLAPGLLPRVADRGRIVDAALPAGVRLGDRYEGRRLALDPGIGLTFFLQRHRLRPERARAAHTRVADDRLDLAGVEWTVDQRRVPLLRLPAFSLTLGAALLLDPPFDDDVALWFAMRWRP